jgi:predicted dehydrogenase
MINVGIIGLGFMGQTHLGCYQRLGDQARVVAIADIEPRRAAGDMSGAFSNVDSGDKSALDMSRVKGFTDYRKLLEMPDVELVDVCVPTPVHPQVAIDALRAGKHVLCEKPLARTSAAARDIVDAAKKSDKFFMPAMCIRFWPQYRWLYQAIQDGRYGRVLSAHFTRLASTPPGWFRDGALSGGAALDLHIHDTDFARYCFGEPVSVSSSGYNTITGEIDHVVTTFRFRETPVVVAEGGWAMHDGFPFRMRFVVRFEQATVEFDMDKKDSLQVFADGKATPIPCDSDTGWFHEIRYFLQCIAENQPPSVVTAEDAYRSVALIEAELRSLRAGQTHLLA